MANTTYSDITKLKNRINATVAASTSQDTMYQAILNASANMVDRYTRGGVLGTECFVQSASATRKYDDRLREDGVIEIDDALTITALTRGTTTIASTSYQLYPYNPGTGPYTRILLLANALSTPVEPFNGSLYGYPYERIGVAQIAVTGTWGYCTAANRPPEIEEATLAVALRRYEHQNLGKGESTVVTASNFEKLYPEAAVLLAPYCKCQGSYLA